MSQSLEKCNLLGLLYEWCVGNKLTPVIAVQVNQRVHIPKQFVTDNRIVFDIGPDAVDRLYFSDTHLHFNTRFSGALHKIVLPIDTILAIYTKEHGHGMVFDEAIELPDLKKPSDDPQKKAPKTHLKEAYSATSPIEKKDQTKKKRGHLTLAKC